MGPKRQSLSFDASEAFTSALEYKLDDSVFVHPKMKNFIQKKSFQHAVEPRMFISSMLGETANVTGVNYKLVEWGKTYSNICSCHSHLIRKFQITYISLGLAPRAQERPRQESSSWVLF